MSLTWASLRAWGEEALEGQRLREIEQGISAVRCGRLWTKTRPLRCMRKRSNVINNLGEKKDRW